MPTNKLKKSVMQQEKVGRDWYFALIHFSLCIFFIISSIGLLRSMFPNGINVFGNFLDILFMSFMIVIFGCAGIGFWLLTIPNLRKLENEITWRNEKNANK